jgi:hypothetical protein
MVQMTLRAIESSVGEGKFFLANPSITTLTTRLRGVGRINGYEYAASFFRFATYHLEKVRPGGIGNTFGKLRVCYHAVDPQILYKNCAELVDNFAAVLMGKVVTFPACAFMRAGNRFTPQTAFFRAFNFFSQPALDFSQVLFFFTKKARIANFLPVRESGKGFKSNIKANFVIQFWQTVRLNFNRKTNIPFARTTTGEGSSFGHTLEGPMQLDFDIPYIRNNQPIPHNLTTSRDLGESHGVVTAITLKPGIANRWFSRLYPAEVGLKSQVYPLGNILQDLGMNFFKGRSLSFKYGNTPLGLIVRKVTLVLFPGLLTHGKGVVVQPATFFELFLKQSGLPPGRPYSVLKSFSHSDKYNPLLGRCQTVPKNLEGLTLLRKERSAFYPHI